jgi:hypothetical protein
MGFNGDGLGLVVGVGATTMVVAGTVVVGMVVSTTARVVVGAVSRVDGGDPHDAATRPVTVVNAIRRKAVLDMSMGKYCRGGA